MTPEERPEQADALEAGQESVWEYPRPPRLELVEKRLRVVFNGVTLAETLWGKRVLETSHPPVYYFPPADVRMEHLVPARETSFCEWKGWAHYFDIEIGGRRAAKAAWTYPDPTPDFLAIKHYLAFYAHPMDACFVGDEQARPQPGQFYGGWITDAIVGPFQGGPETSGW
jgi:uncharacterized protein (DUF427 family)